jgi:hypothetical protein
VHKELEVEFAAEKDVVFIYVQTVFEGSFTNTFDNGLVDLDEYDLNGYYGFDPDGEQGQLPATMQMFSTKGTPYTVIIDKAGEVVESGFTQLTPQLRPIIQNALAAP